MVAADRADWAEVQRRSDEQYRAVVNHAAEAIVVAQDGRVVFANPRAAEITGYPAEEMSGLTLQDLLHPDDVGVIAERTRQRADGALSDPYSYFRIVRKDGSLRSVQSCPVTIEWEGRPASLAFIADLTEKQAAELALRRSEERLRQVVENVDEGIVVAQDGRIVFANPRAAAMSQRSIEELCRLGVQDLIHAEDLPQILERDRARLRGEPGARYTTYRALRRDGSFIWVRSAPVTIEWEGRPATLTFLVDLTEQLAGEEALRRSEQRYRLVVEHVEEGIIVVQDGVLKLCNPATMKIVGFPYEELIGRSITHFIHPEDLPKVLTNYQARLRGEPQGERYDFRVVTSDGRIVWVELGAVLFEWEGRPATLSFLIDVSARKQAEAETRIALDRQQELNYLKTRFLSMTSHEFRTPLATILSSTELLKYYGDRLPAEEKTELYGTIETGVKRMTQLLEDVLVIGKQDSGAERLVTAPLEVERFCRTVVEEVAIAEETQGRTGRILETEFRGDCGAAQLDENQLRHVLVNLLSNALKYTPAGKRVRFRVDGGEREIVFAIADEGIGIAPADMAHLFELFFRAGNVGNTPGTGLGLAIVKRAVDLHHGTIEVSSELGKGTRFTVRLPRGEAMHG